MIDLFQMSIYIQDENNFAKTNHINA